MQLYDAKFTNPVALTNSAFRINGSAGTRVYKVAVCPGNLYSPDVPNVKFGAGTTDTYDMEFYPETSMSAYGIDYFNLDGTDCMYAPNGGTFEFNISDARAKRTGGYIEVNYYDDGDDSLVLNYTNAFNTMEYVEFTNTLQFKTVQIPLNAATFSNVISGADKKKVDFTLSTKNGSPLAITYVKYVPGDSDYVPEVESEVHAVINEDGTAFDGTLLLKRWFTETPDTADYYDREIRFSGKDNLPEVEGRKYSYNKEFKNFASGKSWQQWRNSWFFDVPDDFLLGKDYGKIKIEVDCLICD